MLLALLLLACHSVAAWKASDETIRVVGDRVRRQGLSGWNDDGGGRRLSCFFCGPFDLDYAFYGTKCESTSCGVSICNTDAAPARRISVAAAVAALVSVLIA